MSSTNSSLLLADLCLIGLLFLLIFSSILLSSRQTDLSNELNRSNIVFAINIINFEFYVKRLKVHR